MMTLPMVMAGPSVVLGKVDGGQTPASAAAGANTLNDLTDVNAPSPTNNFALTWDSGTSTWIPEATGAAAIDGNASSICTGGSEVLLGNGTCWDTSNFFDDTDTNISDTNTEKKAESFYLYNDTDEIFLNGTSLNTTIDQRAGASENASWNETYADTLYRGINVLDNNTEKSAAGSYLFNDTTTITFNGTILNDTIDQRATGITNNSAGITLNFSRIFSLDWTNITLLVSQITDWIAPKKAESFYLYNNTDEIFLNGTSLNTTINQLAVPDNSSWNETYADGLYLPHTVIWDATFNASFDERDTDTNISDTQKSALGIYLFNDSDTITFNDTQLNLTIDDRAGSGADGNASSICGDDFVLLGNGTCQNLTAVYEPKSTSGNTVFSFSGSKLQIKVT